MRIPRENLLNSVADVSPSGEYLSAIKNADQVICFFREMIFSLVYLCSSLFQLESLFTYLLLYVILAPEVCCILSPFDFWSCYHCC